MKSPLPRRAAIATLLLAPVLTACGFGAQTDQVYQAATGINDRSGTVEILNAQIVSGTDGTGTLIATLDNTDPKTDDKLTGITGDGVTATSDGVEIPSVGVANLAQPAESGGPQVQISGEKVVAGSWVRLTFTFDNGQSTQVLVPIVSAESDHYADVPLPTEAPTEAPSDAAAE